MGGLCSGGWVCNSSLTICATLEFLLCSGKISEQIGIIGGISEVRISKVAHGGKGKGSSHA